MKRKSQLLALLMALCLLASLAVVPVAAATVAELEAIATAKKQAWDDAESAVATAESALNTAKGSYASEKNAYDSAVSDEASKKSTYESYQQKVSNAETALEAEKAAEEPDQEKISQLEQEVSEAKSAAEAAKSDWDTAKGTLESAKTALDNAETAADIPGKENAVSTAKAAAAQAKKDYEDAKAAVDAAKDEENKPAAPTAPTSSDFSYPSSVNFGTLEKNASSGSRTQTFTIKNKSDYEMKLSYSTPSGYSISGLPSSLTAGSSSTVTVQLNSASSTGNYDRRLTITASFVGGTGSNDFSVNLYATVVEKGYTITVDPTSKDLGKLKEGYTEKEAKEKEITVTVQNKGASNVRMDTVKGNDHFIVTAVKSDSVTLENGDKAEYKIVPKQDLKVGTYTDTITFQTRENTSATFKATVVIEKKLAPLTVEPGTLDFGIVEEGYTALAQKTVTVKNNTEYAIRLDQPTSYSYEVSLLTQTSLPAGGSTTFTIRPRTGLPANAYNGVVELYGSGESAKVNVQFAVTKPAGPSTFSDVAAGSTFAADIAYVSQKGLMSGVGEGRFNPGAPVTRGQLVTILYRLEGQPAVSGAGFPDVAAGSYCEKSVKWAAANGITAGGKDGLFRPGDSITREQLATFLFRYNAYKGYVSTQRANLADFSDGAAVASYAKEALSWANAAKLVNGTSDGRLNPSGGATRGQAAAILHRFCVSIGR